MDNSVLSSRARPENHMMAVIIALQSYWTVVYSGAFMRQR